MRRVQAACLTQTLHFLLKENCGKEYARKMVKEEVEKYKKNLESKGTEYRILKEEIQEDGTIIIEIKKQYNCSPVGHYLD